MGEASDKMKKVKALINDGNGVQHILSEVNEILGNPILIHDMEYKVIAYTEGIVTDDPLWNEFVTTGTVAYSTVALYKDEGFFEAVANLRRVNFLITDKLKYDRINGKLLDKDGIQVGVATIVACNKPFEDDILELFEVICDALSIELCQDSFYANYGQVYLESLISRLIEGEIEGKEYYYTGQVDTIYEGLKDNLYLAVAEIPGCDSTYTQLAYFRDLFNRTQPAYKYFIYSKYILIIASTDDTTLKAKKDLCKLDKLFSAHNIFAGISRRFESLFKLRKYYIEAVHALNNGLKSGSSKRIFLCADNING